MLPQKSVCSVQISDLLGLFSRSKMQPNSSVRVGALYWEGERLDSSLFVFTFIGWKYLRNSLKYLIKKCVWSPGKEGSKGRKQVSFFFWSSGPLLIYSHLLYSFIPKENSPVLCQPACLNHSLTMLLNRRGESYINKGSKI